MLGWSVNHKALSRLTQQAAQYSTGNMSEKIDVDEYPGEFKPLVGHIAALVDMLRGFTQETQVSSGQVSAAVNQVNNAIASSHILAESIRQDAVFINGIANNITEAANNAAQQIDEVMTASQTITSVAGDIYKDSLETKKIAGQGSAAVAEVAQAMQDIQQASIDIETRISALTKMAREIDSFLVTIRGISSQTNLLALNATIEAARAGEHGRGFAVVAQEIQKLSDASATAADSANGLLAQIDSGVEASANAVATGVQAVERGVKAMAQADTSLQAILAASSQVEQQLGQASAARQSQLQATSEAANVLTKMTRLCHEANEHISTVSGSIEQQERHLQETQEMGRLLAKVAGNLVETTQKVTLIDIKEADKRNIKEKIAALKDILKKVVQDKRILGLAIEDHKIVMTELLHTRKELEAAWTNLPDGRFIISLPPAGIANAGSRDWFRQAVRGEFYISPVYVSAISHQPCLTIALPIKNLNDEIIGVLGVDLKL